MDLFLVERLPRSVTEMRCICVIMGESEEGEALAAADVSGGAVALTEQCCIVVYHSPYLAVKGGRKHVIQQNELRTSCRNNKVDLKASQ